MKNFWLIVLNGGLALFVSLAAESTPNYLEMPVRFYQIGQLYGPGMKPSGKEGLHEQIMRKPINRIGLVLVHTWNLGEEDGPYPIKSDDRLPGQVADWVPMAREIIANRIRPVLKAARDADVRVFHLAQSVYAPRYPQYLEISKDPELQSPGQGRPFEVSVNPRSVDEMWQTEYGPDFPGPVWVTHSERFDIAKVLRPLPEEAVVLNGWQLNGLCRRYGIDTLIYAGFMADLCLVNISGAIREMAYQFKYRCVVLRDCTTAYEFKETYQGRWMTFAAIRLIETGLGYSAEGTEFIEACKRTGKGDD
jgi:nicotinamidase-related amidase